VTLPYVPLDERGFRLAMGLRPLDLARWFERDESATSDRLAKEALLRRRFDEVVATRPEGDEAARELAELVAAATGGALTPEHPIVAAARLVADDLCVLTHDTDGSWRLTSACVCAPSRWRLADKMGASLDAIHAPVPGYDDALAQPTQSVFDRLTPERSFWRLNWTLLDAPELFQPSVTRRAPVGDPASWFFRVERQTIRALPRTQAVVFTIRTYVTSLAALLRERPETATQLLASLESAPVATQLYKGWVGVADVLRGALSGDRDPG
jgi:dimethylamine monooxygenase subunit A